MLPVFLIVSESVEELPVVTVPNARLVELKESVSVCATPVPLSGMLAGEPAALLTMLTLPVTAPAAVGENCTSNVVDWPAVRLIGKVAREFVLKPLPVTLTCVIDSVPVPLLLN